VTIALGSTGNRTYTANWSIDGYTITYDANGGTNPTTIPAAWLAYDMEHLPTNISVTPTRAGYTFKGWTGHGLSGMLLPFHVTNTMTGVPGNLTFVAGWDLNIYTLTYDGNGGYVVPGNPATYNVTVFPVVIPVHPTHLDPRYTFIGWSSPQLPTTPKQLEYNIPTGTLMDLTIKANWSKDLDDLNGGSGDSLYVCQAPRVLYGDPQGLTWTWTLPDGSQQTSRDITANVSGRYISRVDYGTVTVSDTLYTFFLADVNTMIDHITTTGAKKGKVQQFVLRLPPEILSKATYVWTVTEGGTIISATDTLTVIWNTVGEKYIFVDLALNYGGVNCTKTLAKTIVITERGLGFYVNHAMMSGAHDGSSWENAYRTIEEALSTATPGDRIWVARGTYSPDAVRGTYIMHQDSVEIFGGFAGSEEYLYERNPQYYPTIMRGNSNNPVVTVVNSAGVRVDGFTISNGRADNGAGVLFTSGSTGTLANDIIKQNVAVQQGGGLYATAPWYGYEGVSLINTEISGNQAATGGGIYNEGGMQLLHATISGNKASARAGGLYNLNSNPRILNSIIWGNVAPGDESTKDVLNTDGGNPYYSYSVIGGSRGSGNWLASFGTDGSGNRDGNPIFLHRGVEDDGATLREGNYHLSSSSMAVNTGNNYFAVRGVFTPWNIWLPDPRQSLSEGLPMDLDYNARISDDDMIDYEYNR
jgi:uncharacterized repeat protein (TIGR02543 family)